MSELNLAALINKRHSDGAINIWERDGSVILSQLNVRDVLDISELCTSLTWQFSVFDSESEPWELDNIDDEFGPYRLEFTLPQCDEGTAKILTVKGFEDWIHRNSGEEVVYIALLTTKIICRSVALVPWGDEVDFHSNPIRKNPNHLVRQYGTKHLETDISRFLLAHPLSIDLSSPISQIWAKYSFKQLSINLSSEIDLDQGSIQLNGPPKVSLAIPSEDNFSIEAKEIDNFLYLQEAATWVYEDEHSAEMRHILFSVELARLHHQNVEYKELFLSKSHFALESARLAYQLGISDISSETLKALTDLRKSVSDETSKLNDLTRQLFTATTSALIIGLGLIAIRLGKVAEPSVIIGILIVVDMHVAMTIYAGNKFISLQNDIYSQWKGRLHSYLSEDEYQTLVKKPLEDASCNYKHYVILCALAVFILSCSVLLFASRQVDYFKSAPQKDTEQLIEEK